MRCPGQDSRYWKSEAIFDVKCPQCGSSEEFFKDETTRLCKKCGHKIINNRLDFGCASYCKFADQCLGEIPSELLAHRKELLKDRVVIEMKRFFKRDFKRIGHASKVARYTEEIVAKEGGDLAVALIAAYLHDVGITIAEQKYGNRAFDFHEEEGEIIAREMLSNLVADQSLIDEVCDIVGHHHHPREHDTINFRSVYDADTIVKIEEEQKDAENGTAKLEGIIQRDISTKGGRELAKRILLT
ncbi:MAG: HD domain-containing protein [Spirochaetota bacterium]|nr:HD domain-containing protein [Spirochaetota bacterium]